MGGYRSSAKEKRSRIVRDSVLVLEACSRHVRIDGLSARANCNGNLEAKNVSKLFQDQANDRAEEKIFATCKRRANVTEMRGRAF